MTVEAREESASIFPPLDPTVSLLKVLRLERPERFFYSIAGSAFDVALAFYFTVITWLAPVRSTIPAMPAMLPKQNPRLATPIPP
ncbi:MAG: hypothetical protein OXC72_15005 [Roseovarius sp.]|nr:hypothetical protein [Roseovarius sp.]